MLKKLSKMKVKFNKNLMKNYQNKKKKNKKVRMLVKIGNKWM